jgi:DNA-binding XRE family transcriptional regulator
MSFGQHLRRLREAAGLSRADLAPWAGVPASTLRNWEGDRGFPALPAALWLAAGFSAAARSGPVPGRPPGAPRAPRR